MKVKMSELKLAKCAECQGEVKLLPGKDRTREYRKGVNLPIPDSYLLPTCINCKEESMVPEISDHLDKFLGDLYEKKLVAQIKKLKEENLLYKSFWHKDRELIGKLAWSIPGAKSINYLDLSEEARKKFDDFVKHLED